MIMVDYAQPFFNCFKLLTAAPKAEVKMYSCDVDICDTEGSPVCKPLEEAGPGLLDMEGDISFLADNLCIQFRPDQAYKTAGLFWIQTI